MINKRRELIRALIGLVCIFAVTMLADCVFAFHEGGVGYCDGCHVLHGDSEDRDMVLGVESEPTGPQLQGSDPSSTCLRCHAEQGKFYNVLSKDGSSHTPGGDFYWLNKTFVWTVNAVSYKSPGDSHGHNIVAADYGLSPDQKRSFAPGGTFPSDELGCTSCHNPHGITGNNASYDDGGFASEEPMEDPPPGTAYGQFRLLGDTGYASGATASSVIFENPSPIAVANPGNWKESDTNHVAYGSGMSEWCSNCHSYLLDHGTKHPAGTQAVLDSTVVFNYNAYVQTGNITGNRSNAYFSLVPFETGTSSRSLLDPSSMEGPGLSGRANVMCLTCHRGHASAFQNMGRWDFQTTFIVDSHPKAGDGGISGNDVWNSYYGRNMASEYGKYQRQFCNKCHLKD